MDGFHSEGQEDDSDNGTYLFIKSIPDYEGRRVERLGLKESIYHF